MLTTKNTRRIYLYQILTLGLYFYSWCTHSGSEINVLSGRKLVPSAWWFALPFGGYWWIWQYANSLDAITTSKIKLADVFLYYIIAVNAWIAVLGLGTGTSVINLSNKINIVSLILYLALIFLAAILGHAFFCASIQNKINNLPVRDPSIPPQNLQLQR